MEIRFSSDNQIRDAQRLILVGILTNIEATRPAQSEADSNYEEKSLAVQSVKSQLANVTLTQLVLDENHDVAGWMLVLIGNNLGLESLWTAFGIYALGIPQDIYETAARELETQVRALAKAWLG